MTEKAVLQSHTDAEKALRQDPEELAGYLRDLWQFVPLALSYVDPDGTIVEANRALADMVGVERTADLVGEQLGTVFWDDTVADTLHEEVMNTGGSRQRSVRIAAKGERCIVNVSANLRHTNDGEGAGYYVALTDITELEDLRQELEEKVNDRTRDLEEKVEELRDSRRALMNILEDVKEARRSAEEERTKVRAIINNFVDALLFFDERDMLRIVNPKAESVFDCAASDLVGAHIEDVEKPEALRNVLDMVQQNSDLSREEIHIGEERVYEVSALPILRAEEEIGRLVIVHDITREKRVERLKSEFVSIAAHQLRTPLSAIKWTLRMLLDGELGQLNKEQLDFVEKTYRSNERMIALINDLLNVTRIEEGRYIYEREWIDFEEMCRNVADSLEEEMQRKDIQFGFMTPPEELPEVNIDEEKVRLVVQNLIDNAIKYTKPGGHITVTLSQPEEGTVQFEIEDDGVGIPGDQQERIFSRFFRGANIQRMDTTGTGLGLFIAKNIIEAHDGEIWFESTEGEGTTFYFTLPVDSAQQPQEEGEDEESGGFRQFFNR